MDKKIVVYEQSKDLHIRNYVVYSASGKDYLYTDSACTDDNKIDKADLIDIYKKGMLVAIGSDFYTPTMLDVDSDSASVILLDFSSTTVAKIVKHSKEYSA